MRGGELAGMMLLLAVKVEGMREKERGSAALLPRCSCQCHVETALRSSLRGGASHLGGFVDWRKELNTSRMFTGGTKANVTRSGLRVAQRTWDPHVQQLNLNHAEQERRTRAGRFLEKMDKLVSFLNETVTNSTRDKKRGKDNLGRKKRQARKHLMEMLVKNQQAPASEKDWDKQSKVLVLCSSDRPDPRLVFVDHHPHPANHRRPQRAAVDRAG